MSRISPEMAVWGGAFCHAVSDYFNGNVTAKATDHGSEVHLEIANVPEFGKKRVTVIVVVPKGTLSVSRSCVRLTSPLLGDNVRYLQSDGKSFAHPHVWETGRPCWGGSQIATLMAFFQNVVNTITWRNVTEDSMNYGHFTPNPCTSALGRNPLRSIEAHKARVKRELKYSDEPPGQFFSGCINGYLDFALRAFA